MGDFNINFDDKLINTSDNKSLSLLKHFIIKNQPLYQFITSPTRLNHIIDLLFSNCKNLISNVLIKAPISNSDHNLLQFRCAVIKPKQNQTIIKNFKNCDYVKINSVFNKLKM